MSWYLENDDDFRKRCVDHAFKQNPNITTYEELVDSFKESYDTPKGRRILEWWNDDESKALWNSNEVQERVKENRGVDQSEDLSDEPMDYDVERTKNKGEPTKAKDIQVVHVPKSVQVHSYSSGDRRVSGYSRSYSKWSTAERKFLEVRKAKGYSTNEITKEYNQVFKEKPRSEKSIKSKVYRI